MLGKYATLALSAVFVAACARPAPQEQAAPADARVLAARPAAMLDQLTLETPAPGARLTSPFVVSGAAPGFWYFEAVFPITLVDETGQVLAEAPGQARDNWMTERPVPFRAEIAFDVAQETKAWLVLAKDNPSGEAINDGQVRVPVTLLPARKP